MESEWILGRLAEGVWIAFNWLKIGTGGEFLRHGVSYLYI
jgi:hypothetical protein